MAGSISNIIGTAIPDWLLTQLKTRSQQGIKLKRNDDNLKYLANKTAWIRLVSSVNLEAREDMQYFSNLIGYPLINPDSLAKDFVLQAGTSVYTKIQNSATSYTPRQGFKETYNILNDGEVNQFGYRPMPGLTRVSIETQGKLGSIRMATIEFKVWDKSQLDVMDALYFKLGFTMYLEWGHNYYYDSSADTSELKSTELFSLDPFAAGLSKEKIQLHIGRNRTESKGNYDGMLGMVVNFNFSYNQEGGYDCTLKMAGLGTLAESMKINQPETLPNILKAQIDNLNNIYSQIKKDKETADQKAADAEKAKTESEKTNKDLIGKTSIFQYLNNQINPNNPNRKDPNAYPTAPERIKIAKEAGILNSGVSKYEQNSDSSIETNFKNLDYLYNKVLYVPKFGVKISKEDIENKNIKTISLNKTILTDKLNALFGSGLANSNNTPKLTGYVDRNILDSYDYLYNTGNTSSAYGKVFTIGDYAGNNNDSYVAYISITLPTDVNYIDKNSRFKSVLKDILDNQDFKFTKIAFDINKVIIGNITPKNEPKYYITLSGESSFDTSAIKATPTQTQDGIKYTDKVETSPIKAKAKFDITITDSALISSIEESTNLKDPFAEYIKAQAALSKQDTEAVTAPTNQPAQGSSSNQTKPSSNTQSSLECILRTIQVYSLTEAIATSGRLDIGKDVKKIELFNENKEKDLSHQIFSVGIFKDIIKNLIYDSGLNESVVFNKNAKYGFNASLMSNRVDEETKLEIPKVNYKELLTSYVIPYDVNANLNDGTQLNHPVYIQLGLLLMILNDVCLLYDEKKDSINSDSSTPLIYLDFNPETNFCLSNPSQLSTDAFSFLIPFEGTFESYVKLFDDSVLTADKKKILGTSENKETTDLFDPSSVSDMFLNKIPKFKYTGVAEDAYRGKIMKVLVSIDYIFGIIKQYLSQDSIGNLYLKSLLDNILSDMNKSLGNFNAFRVYYDDAANALQIVDDQMVPGLPTENSISKEGKTDLPLFGANSIAKTLELKTDLSTKINNMLAISANSDWKKQSSNSTDASPIGAINNFYYDRYINNRVSLTNSGSNDTQIESALTFNKNVKQFYGTFNPSVDTIHHATNYYIQKMSKNKNENYPTRAAAMIPVSVNFSTDGISGFGITQGFTIPDQLLPYTYGTRAIKVNKYGKTEKDSLQKVGFITTGINHVIEANQWTTSIKGSMIYLKNRSDFQQDKLSDNKNLGGIAQYNPDNATANDNRDNLLTNLSSYKNTVTQFQKVTFIKGVDGGDPASDISSINQKLLSDISVAAINANVEVAITTAITGHTSTPSRHKTGQAVDIAIINRRAVSLTNQTDAKALVKALESLGYVINSENGNPKAVLSFGFAGHDNHVHVSNTQA